MLFRSIRCEQSAQSKSTIYQDVLPLFNAGRIQLLDHDKLISQLCGLERRTRIGADIIDHVKGGHDDLANAACGAISLAMGSHTKERAVGRVLKSVPARTARTMNLQRIFRSR